MIIKNHRSITITEYGRIYANETYDDVEITTQDIRDLKNYIDEQNSMNYANYNEFLRPIRNGVQVNNFVGVLQTKSGLTIEILPKIYGKSGQSDDKRTIRQLFLKMLNHTLNIDSKKFEMTNLDFNRNNLFEIFISMFLLESANIIKRGLKSDYINLQSNEKFLKGKLLMMQQIRKNSINQSYFYNEFDEYLVDIPENKIIKTTLEFLLIRSKDNHNLKLIREQLMYLNNVGVVNDFKTTFNKVQIGRSFSYYEQALEWCKVILNGYSFSSFRGSSLAFAILFPMEKVFESYIAELTKTYLTGYNVSTQDRLYSLFDKTENTNGAYSIRPDIVLREKSFKQTIIADTKWKILDRSGPTQFDLYQMYAYFTRYTQQQENVEKVVLIYPYSKSYFEQEFRSIQFPLEKLSSRIQVRFVDLLSDDIENQILQLFREE